WLPDQSAIVVRRQRNCHRGNLASAGLWAYPLDSGSPRELVKESELAAGWPSPSRDGASLYYHYAVCPGYHAGRNDLVRGCMQIRRLHLPAGGIVEVPHREAVHVSPRGGGLAFARRSPDGTLSFRGHRYGPRNALWLRSLRTGEERVVMDPIETDLAHGLPYSMHLLPTYAGTPDSSAIVISQGGRIRRVRIADGKVETIPFEARVHRVISESTYVSRRLPTGPVASRFVRWPATAPDGSTILF